MKGKQQQDFRVEKYIRYGIRKYSFGAASVAIAAGLMFLGNGAVSANEAAVNGTTPDSSVVVSNPENDGTSAKPATSVTEKEVKAEESKKVDTPVQKEAEDKKVAEEKTVEAPKATVEKAAEKVAANKTALHEAISSLENRIAAAKNADASAISAAEEVLAIAKSVFANPTAEQAEVDSQTEALKALVTVLVESNAAETAKKEEAANQKQETPAVDTKVLNQVASEAEVTSQLAYSEMDKKDLAAEGKAAIEAAVAKNQAVLAETNKLLADKSLTKEQVDAQLNRLNESIQAVYDELKRNGIGRDGKFAVALSANEGYTASSTELRKENGEFITATGKSYKTLDGNSSYRVYVHGYQSENTEIGAANSGRPDVSGRTDIPLSKTEAQKLANEALLWRGKVRASGKNNNTNTWGAGGPYEYLATEIYGYTYEQGTHYVYLTDVKKRFSLSPEAEAAGYTIKNIQLSNLVPGTAYNEKTDTVEGYVASNLQNGVYDMRYILTIEKDGQSQEVTFRDLTAGWIGWQDSSAPTILGTSKMVTIGDEVDHDIKYVDNEGMNKDERAGYVYANNGSKVLAGSKTAPSTSKAATFTAVDGTKIRTMNSPQTINAHTALNGVYTGKDGSITDVIPGLSYNPTTGKVHGTTSEAGIYTVAAYAKDYNNATNAKNVDWNMDGQEAHENITIAVAPKITVANVEAYATKVPVTVSNGANKAEITMPDGTVTNLVVKDGKWTVAPGTTNTAVKEGDQLADASTTAPTKFNLPVTSDSTQYVGINSIEAKASTDKVRADIQREIAIVKDAAGKSYTATFNRATGKYTLSNEDAYVLKDNGDGTSTLTERRVYTDAKENGDVDFIVYEFTRTWSATSTASGLIEKVAEIRKNGEVTAVGDVTRTVTPVPRAQTADKQGLIVTVSYDSATKQWTASDGSTVTAKESNAGWSIETSSGFKGYVSYREAIGNDVASIQNDKPTASSTSYAETKDNSVDLLKSPKANVEFEDVIDDKSDDAESETIKTKLTVTAPDGTKKEFNLADAEEKAYIQAQRTAAEKTQAAATAIEDVRVAQNELAGIQEQVDRQVQMIADAEAALANLKLRTISVTAKDLAEKKLKDVKDFKASLDEKLKEAQGKLPELTAKVTSSRQEALEAEKAVEAARTALKTKAAENLSNPEVAAYTLGQYGSYKVTVRAVDSNGVVTTPTVGKTDAGEVTEDAVAETTYYIVVSKPEKSSGAEGQEQTDSMETGFKTGLPNNAEVSDYKLVDPVSGKKTDSVTTEEGTYAIDGTTGAVSFTPAPGFIGNAKPLTVAANVTITGDDGQPVVVESTTTYTPTVYGVKPKDDKTTGKQGQVQTSIPGSERFSALNTTANTPDNTNVDWTTAKYSLEGANEEGKVVVEGEGTYAIDPTTGAVTFTPEPSFKGQAKGVEVKVSVTATDSEGNKVEVTSSGDYTPEVEAVEPTAEPKETSGKQGRPQTQDATTMFKEGDKSAPIDKSTIKLVDPTGAEVTTMPALKDGKEVGTYTLDPETGVITFQPNKDFTGTPDPAKVTAADKNGTKVETTYTPTVTPVVPEGFDNITTGVQGQEQKGKPYFKPGNEAVPINYDAPAILLDPETKKPVPSNELPAKDPEGNVIGKYTLNPTTGEVKFTPIDKSYVGPVQPVTVQRVDKNNTPATADYTPVIVGVKPTAKPAESTDVQGATQKQPITFKGGTADLEDPAGNPIKSDPVPVNPGSVTLVGENGKPTDEVVVKDPKDPNKVIGKYTLVKEPGKDPVAVYTPEDKTYVGKVPPVTIQAADMNGTPVRTTYTPNIKPVKPTATPAKTTDVQGKAQTGLPEFKGGTVSINGEEKVVPIDETKAPKLIDPTTGEPTEKVVVEGEGTYSIEDGKVKFQPEPQFTGTATGVEVQREDTNGTTVKAKYTPTVTPVKPTGEDVTSEDIQGAKQTGTPVFKGGDDEFPIDNKVPAKLIDPETGEPTDEPVVIPGEGTYTIEDGKVKFQPEPQFTGKGEGVEVQRVDKNGTPVTAKYTPKVVPVTPTGEDETSVGPKGQTQKGTPVFNGGSAKINGKEETVEIDKDVPAKLVDPKTGDPVDSVTVEGEGTYTIDPKTGEVTFKPEPEFLGTATGVTVQRVDKNGTEVTAKYTPTVTPVTATVDKTSEGPKNTPQSETPEFTGDVDLDVPPTFDDGTTTRVVEGEGTYTIDKDGKVTFTPDPEFTGTADGITVVRKDKLGKTISATYTPTVRPDTEFVDENGNPIKGYPSEDGTTPKKDIPEYRYVETVTDEHGNTRHIYKQVVTFFKDKEGKEIPNYPVEKGTTPKKDNVPEYRFVETKKLPNGDTEHVYEKVKTSFKDKEGKEIPNYPTEEGKQPKKDIPGYRFVETKPLPNGDTEHVYEKVTTFFKDKDGNEIKDKESGFVDKKDIPGYRFVETKKLPNGDTEHVYEKVSTPLIPQTEPGKQITTTWTDEKGNPLKPMEPGSKEPGTIPGYEYVKTVTDPNGNIRHIFKKVEMPTPRPVEPSQPVQPVSPQEPTSPEKPVTPDMPVVPEQPKQPATPKYVEGQKELPNTGTEDNARLAALGLLGVLSGFGLVSRKKKED